MFKKEYFSLAFAREFVFVYKCITNLRRCSFLNTIDFLGRIGASTKFFPASGEKKAFINFSIAVKRNRKDETGQYPTDWFDCIAIGRTAELVNKHCPKGSLMAFRARPSVKKFVDKAGNNRQMIEFFVEDIALEATFAASKGDDQSQNQNSYQPQAGGYQPQPQAGGYQPQNYQPQNTGANFASGQQQAYQPQTYQPPVQQPPAQNYQPQSYQAPAQPQAPAQNYQPQGGYQQPQAPAQVQGGYQQPRGVAPAPPMDYADNSGGTDPIPF